ncbi:MAG: hypothetical protein OXH92_04775 [Bryobacterales bacterium]|nr:hypothetical protein [Bryobacterales bacterium]MDE0294681.1 hypothetical protein [Bryobacterales bacterium]MDE0433299.1 hypothetical protein [Bryobacterales bacterium]
MQARATDLCRRFAVTYSSAVAPYVLRPRSAGKADSGTAGAYVQR